MVKKMKRHGRFKINNKVVSRKDLDKLIKERTTDYVCFECGRQFLTEEEKKHPRISTFHMGECALCKEEHGITNIRHYNYLRIFRDPIPVPISQDMEIYKYLKH